MGKVQNFRHPSKLGDKMAAHTLLSLNVLLALGSAAPPRDTPSRPASPQNLTVIALRPANLSGTLVNKNSADAPGGVFTTHSMNIIMSIY